MNNWRNFLLLVNNELRPLERQVEVKENRNGCFNVNIVSKDFGAKSFATNYTEEELSKCVLDAWEDAREAGDIKRIYTITRVAVSPDKEVSGECRVWTFKDHKAAMKSLLIIKAKEVERMNRAGVRFHITKDEDGEFILFWDRDTQQVRIKVYETEVL